MVRSRWPEPSVRSSIDGQTVALDTPSRRGPPGRSLLRVLAFALAAAPWVAGCSVDWSLDPTAEGFKGKGGAAAGGGGAGGGGTGGAPCVPEACPTPPDECQAAACVNGQCGSQGKPDGTACGVEGALQCAGGACKCTDAAQCTPAECNDVTCPAGECVYTPAPSGTCGPDGAGSCSADGFCGLCDDGVQNGAETGVDCGPATSCGACPGEPCAGNGECAGGSCADGVCCDAACDGPCEACTGALTGGQDGVCAALAPGMSDPDHPECDSQGGCGTVAGHCLCDDGVKNGAETDVDCGGACGGTCTTGQRCGASDGNCANGNPCVDGVCCNSDCGSKCGSCDQPGLAGLCSPLTVAPDGECKADEQCTADFACKRANGQACGNSGECASGLCKTQCVACDAAGNLCTASKACVDGRCVPRQLAKGESCLDTVQCDPGLTCVDGVCCESACDGACMACHINYTAQASGTCAPLLSGYDPQDECQGPGGAAACSGQPADANGDSACGQP